MSLTIALLLAGPLEDTANALASSEPQAADDATVPVTVSSAPDKEGDNAHEGDSANDSGLLLATFSALLGALGALGVDYLLRRRSERLAFKSAIRSLRDEIEANEQESQRRAGAELAGFAFYPPLASTAWNALSSSSLFPQLARDEDSYRSLQDLYTSVDTANALSDAAWQAMTLSQQAQDPAIARGFHEESLRLLVWPYRNVSDAAAIASRLLGERME